VHILAHFLSCSTRSFGVLTTMCPAGGGLGPLEVMGEAAAFVWEELLGRDRGAVGLLQGALGDHGEWWGDPG
jgi:hypothetical protein